MPKHVLFTTLAAWPTVRPALVKLGSSFWHYGPFAAIALLLLLSRLLPDDKD